MAMKQTYHLTWEVIQEFKLPLRHSCCSVDVNEALGEIMFACRHNGLLHYKWSPITGLVMATSQPNRVTNYARNCRLVNCCSDGSYLVLNHRQLRYVRLTNSSTHHSMHIASDNITSTDRKCSFYTVDSLTAYSRSVSHDYIEYLEQAVSVGDVRSIATDKQADSVFLLYADRLVRSTLTNLSDSCVFDRCLSLSSELLNVKMSRQFVYLMNSVGDILLRYRSECYDKRDQLFWRPIGSRAFASPAVMEKAAKIDSILCRSCDHYLPLLDSESPACSLGLAVDPWRQLVFAATGETFIYAMWHPELEPDLSSGGWAKNWLEDIRIDLSEAHGGEICRGSTVVTGEEANPSSYSGSIHGSEMDFDASAFNGPLVPGPMACATSTFSRSGYLYVVDAVTGNRVTVLKYSTESARVS